jgi:hypothetical protein
MKNLVLSVWVRVGSLRAYTWNLGGGDADTIPYPGIRYVWHERLLGLFINRRVLLAQRRNIWYHEWLIVRIKAELNLLRIINDVQLGINSIFFSWFQANLIFFFSNEQFQRITKIHTIWSCTFWGVSNDRCFIDITIMNDVDSMLS